MRKAVRPEPNFFILLHSNKALISSWISFSVLIVFIFPEPRQGRGELRAVGAELLKTPSATSSCKPRGSRSRSAACASAACHICTWSFACRFHVEQFPTPPDRRSKGYAQRTVDGGEKGRSGEGNDNRGNLLPKNHGNNPARPKIIM